MALDGIDRFRHRFRRGEIAETPTRHRIGFAEPVDCDREIVGFLRERRDAHVLCAVINELLVNLVGQNINVLFSGDIDNRLHFLARINGTGRIAWTVQDQHLCARRHRVFKIRRAKFPGIALTSWHDHRVAAG